MSRRPSWRGFTLAELTVTMVIFSLFATTIAGVMQLSLSYWSRTNNFVIAEQNARIAMSTICTEFRQAMHPPSQPSEILVPDADNTSAPQLVFLESSPSYNPVALNFNIDDPSNYQQINYFVSGGAMNREIITFNSAGAIVNDITQVLVQAVNGGSLTLNVTRLATNQASIFITSQEGTFTYVLNTQNVSAVMQ